MQYVAAIGPRGILEKFCTDTSEAEGFARTHDKAPNGVFDCVAELKPEAARRGRRLEHVESVGSIHTDVDVRDLMVAGRDEVRGRLMSLPAPFEVRDSGGGFHVVQHLKNPAHAGTEALDRVAELRSRLTTVLAGDRACNHNVSLLRRLSTHNYKYGEGRLCQIIRPGIPVTLDEAGTVIESLGVNPLFGRGAIDRVLNPTRIARTGGEIDPYALLREMSYRGTPPINQSQLLATKALMHEGMTLLRTVRIVLRATKDAVRGNPECAGWDWGKEEEQIAGMCYGAVDKYPQLYVLLEPVHRAMWESHLKAGRKPRFVRTNDTDWVVGEAPEPPPKMVDIDGWHRRVMADTRLTGCALRHVYFNVLPAIRATGYAQIRPTHAAQTIQESRRTVQRAHGLLVECGHLHPVAGGGRVPRYVPVICAKSGAHREISKKEER